MGNKNLMAVKHCRRGCVAQWLAYWTGKPEISSSNLIKESNFSLTKLPLKGLKMPLGGKTLQQSCTKNFVK